jgi:SAM-dependent methyltransferase
VNEEYCRAKTPEISAILEQCQANRNFFLSAAFSRPVTRAREGFCAEASKQLIPQGALFERVKIKPINKNGGIGYFAEFFGKEKSFHRAYDFDEFLGAVTILFPRAFKNFVVNFCRDSQVFTMTALSNKKGKITLIDSRQKTNQETPALHEHNRVKRYIIPEGDPVPFLVHLGVMTDKGMVIASMQKKFRQINRFLESVDGCVKVFGGAEGIKQAAADENRAFRILDFGCGKSYLTFAAHHLFTRVYGIPVEITGIDQKKDVVSHCEELARHLSCAGLSFTARDIELFPADAPSAPPDLLIALHACDTATDAALAYAVTRNVRAILCAPCCQHELNALLAAQNTRGEFAPFMRHGLLKERFASLATDAIRTALLENAGYAVQLLEFVDDDTTPKNLLIRAVKTNAGQINTAKDPLSQALGVTLTLENLLKKHA